MKDAHSGQKRDVASRGTISRSLITRAEITILAIAALVALLAFWWGNVQQAQQTDGSEKLTGLLILAGAGLAADGTTSWMTPMTFDAGLNKLSVVPADRLAAAPAKTNLAYQHVFSHNGAFVTFIGAADIASSTKSIASVSSQVYRADVSGAKSYNEFLSLIQNASQLTTSGGWNRQFPSVSNTGDIVYQAQPVSSDVTAMIDSPANEWSIFLIKQGSTEGSVLTAGIHPIWVDTKRFVFLKNDGLYIFDTDKGSAHKVWVNVGTSTMRESLAVSDGGKYLAWSSTDANVVSVFQVSDWLVKGGVTLQGIIHDPATAAVFSPDEESIAVLAPEATSSSLGNWKTNVNFYDLGTFARYSKRLQVSGLEPGLSYLTDWRP